MKPVFNLACLAGCLILASSTAAGSTSKDERLADYNTQQIQKALNWQNRPEANLCGGRFQIDPAIAGKTPDAGLLSADTDISADKTTYLSEQESSVFKGNVVVKQKGRMLKARRAYVDRCQDSGKICRIRLIGPLTAEDPEIRFVSEKGRLDFDNNRLVLNQLYYRVLQRSNGFSNDSAWGSATKVTQKKNGPLNLENATYSTCRPGASAWRVHAGNLELNQQEQRAIATNAWLDFYHIPVFYSPYLSFPMGKKRKTGFLAPDFNSSSRQGFTYSQPFYVNLAPNYDYLVTPQYMGQRGYKVNNTFRYLTPASHGKIRYEHMFDDKRLRSFKQKRIRQGLDLSDPAARRLVDTSVDRDYLGLEHTTRFSDRMTMNIIGNYVSDDYYFQDFQQGLTGATENHLLNRAEFTYDSDNWNGLLRFQGYQTLHPVNEDHIDDKYSRLPDIRWDGRYLDLPYHLQFDWDNQGVYFDHAQTFADDGKFPTGLRFYTGPELTWDYESASGFFKPSVKVFNTAYRTFTDTDDTDENSVNAVPSMSVDSGLYFKRRLPWTVKPYQQTLEPRLYYLYTPYVSQQRQPNFDTSLPQLDHDKLFSKNRFTGVDRISNANRLTLGLTSRVLDPYNGNERFKLRLTDAVYLQDYKVCGDDDCDIRDESDYVMSPFVGEMAYNINSKLRARTDAVYDPAQSKISNAGAELTYHTEHNRIVDLGYNFVQGEDEFPGAPDGDSRNDLNRIQAGMAWPVYHHWHAFGHMTYNISHGFKQNAFYGMEYNGCCWALRVMRNTNLIAVDDQNSPEYDRDLFIQFSLKGLNKLSTSDPHHLLTSGLHGYNDVFEE